MPIQASFYFITSYSLTTWNVRTDEWATALFLSFLYPNSLLAVSIYSLACSLATILTAGGLGYMVDRFPRLPFLCCFLVIQKLCIAGIALLLWSQVEFQIFPVVSTQDRALDLTFVLVVLVGIILKIANTATTIAVERDWVMVIAKNKIELSKYGYCLTASLNSTLKRVDLIGKLVAPMVVSLIALGSISIVMIVIASISTLSSVFECSLMIWVYGLTPSLALKRNTIAEEIVLQTVSQNEAISTGIPQPSRLPIWKSSIFPTCISISLLYLNVLAFGPVMISLLTAYGVTAPIIAALRAISVFFGIIATFTFPKLIERIGLVRSGLWAIWSEIVMLSIAVVSFFVSPPLTSLILLSTGVSLSRWGLWTFDLTQGQIVQEVEFDRIGSIAGIQTTMQNVFDLLSYVVTIIWYNPSQFWIPCSISLGCVILAAIIYTRYAILERGHLLHFGKLGLKSL